ncbi:MAG TPA: CopG family transcriptional regulator [Bdellovibrionota bacterium]|nr:CopG family transcriptional regulator [Bdellovibrionota bacterium]
MPKTLTLRVNEETYNTIKRHAELDHRPIANFIEYALKRYVQEADFSDEFETLEILGNQTLVERLRKGSQDAARKKGRFVA